MSVFSMFLRLECDQECVTLERNRRLAEALQIDPSSDPFSVRSTSVYSDSLKEDARCVTVHGQVDLSAQHTYIQMNSILLIFSEKT